MISICTGQQEYGLCKYGGWVQGSRLINKIYGSFVPLLLPVIVNCSHLKLSIIADILIVI